jgi:hypothetical protein
MTFQRSSRTARRVQTFPLVAEQSRDTSAPTVFSPDLIPSSDILPVMATEDDVIGCFPLSKPRSRVRVPRFQSAGSVRPGKRHCFECLATVERKIDFHATGEHTASTEPVLAVTAQPMYLSSCPSHISFGSYWERFDQSDSGI